MQIRRVLIWDGTGDTNLACGDEAAAEVPGVAARGATARHNLCKAPNAPDPHAAKFRAPYIPH
jgi:hypothetical protein